MFKSSFTVFGTACRPVSPSFNPFHAKARFIPLNAVVPQDFIKRRFRPDVCAAVLSILATVALPYGAEATTVGVYSAAQSRFDLAKPGSGTAQPLSIKIKGVQSSWLPMLGAGTFQFGLYDPATGTFYFRLENSSGFVTQKMRFEGFQPDWLPIAGDWDGDRAYGVGLYDPQTGTFYLKNQLTSGPADTTVRLGNTQENWRPLVGDWDGDGDTTVGAYNPGNGQFYLRNANTDGPADLTMRIEGLKTTLLPVAADWDNDGVWSPGLYNPASQTFYWRNALNTGLQQGRTKLAGVSANALPVTRSVSITEPTPAVTDVGAAIGGGATAAIGSGGGTLRSPDNVLLLTIPPGALAAKTNITIQPISNHAHCGKGKAYRLLPGGQIFKQPVKLTFRYTAKDLNGTAAAELGGAFQTPDGYWRWVENPVLDADAQSVTIATTHFADFAEVEDFHLSPETAKVFVNKTLPLALETCYPSDVDLGTLQGSFDAYVPPISQPQWAVNGVPGGGRTQGTIKGGIYSATYKAPRVKPESNPVAVSARISPLDSGPGEVLLVSNITISDEVKTYTGAVAYTTHVGQVSAKAKITWVQIESPSGGTHSYAATVGNIVADIKLDNCDLLRTSMPLEDKHLVSELSVYDETNTVTPKTYLFDVWPDRDAVLHFTCYDYDGRPYAYDSYAVTWLALAVSSCSVDNPTPPAYKDALTLKGSLACPSYSFDASWSFKGVVLE